MNRRSLYLILISILIVVIDQLIKLYVVPTFKLPVWYNEGISFSIQLGGAFQTVIISIVFFTVSLWLWKHDMVYKHWLTFLASVLVSGGAVGNLVDRIRLDGKVLDYIAILYFPVFNFADVCISIGVGALILHVYLFERTAEIQKE